MVVVVDNVDNKKSLENSRLLKIKKSARRDSNPRPRPWQGKPDSFSVKPSSANVDKSKVFLFFRYPRYTTLKYFTSSKTSSNFFKTVIKPFITTLYIMEGLIPSICQVIGWCYIPPSDTVSSSRLDFTFFVPAALSFYRI